jgi:NAD(P)-dependent dehydrogenase (short-subunit alcohol dehydrogenase family)
MRLENQVFVVTGAAQGIGAEYARGLSEEGAKVAVADINLQKAESTAHEIGPSAHAFHVDVTSEASCAAMASAVAEHFGGIDGLVNNAAIFQGIQMSPLMEVPLDYWNKIVDTNLTSVLICTRAVVPFIRRRGRGKIVNQSSMSAYMAGNHYSVTKRAVSHLTMGLAVELAPFDINVNAIAPGVITTPAFLESYAGNLDFIVEHLQLFKRAATARDLVGTLVFLCSSDSDWITGQTLHVDGGIMLNPIGMALAAKAQVRET